MYPVQYSIYQMTESKGVIKQLEFRVTSNWTMSISLGKSKRLDSRRNFSIQAIEHCNFLES